MSNIEEIEISIEHAREIIGRGEKLQKLTSNREFKALVLDGYFKDEAARLVSLSAEPSVKEHHGEIMEGIRAISHLQQYFRLIGQMAQVARKDLTDHEELMDDMRRDEMGMEA